MNVRIWRRLTTAGVNQNGGCQPEAATLEVGSAAGAANYERGFGGGYVVKSDRTFMGRFWAA